MIFVVGGSGVFTYAFIVVNWPEGSTCQIVRSGDSKTLKAKDTSGHFVFRRGQLCVGNAGTLHAAVFAV